MGSDIIIDIIRKIKKENFNLFIIVINMIYYNTLCQFINYKVNDIISKKI